MDVSNMPDRKFKVMIIKILTGLEKKMEVKTKKNVEIKN